jgi:hypothetical protein
MSYRLTIKEKDIITFNIIRSWYNIKQFRSSAEKLISLWYLEYIEDEKKYNIVKNLDTNDLLIQIWRGYVDFMETKNKIKEIETYLEIFNKI